MCRTASWVSGLIDSSFASTLTIQLKPCNSLSVGFVFGRVFFASSQSFGARSVQAVQLELHLSELGLMEDLLTSLHLECPHGSTTYQACKLKVAT